MRCNAIWYIRMIVYPMRCLQLRSTCISLNIMHANHIWLQIKLLSNLHLTLLTTTSCAHSLCFGLAVSPLYAWLLLLTLLQVQPARSICSTHSPIAGQPKRSLHSDDCFDCSPAAGSANTLDRSNGFLYCRSTDRISQCYCVGLACTFWSVRWIHPLRSPWRPGLYGLIAKVDPLILSLHRYWLYKWSLRELYACRKPALHTSCSRSSSTWRAINGLAQAGIGASWKRQLWGHS